jgi:hypothetical protein
LSESALQSDARTQYSSPGNRSQIKRQVRPEYLKFDAGPGVTQMEFDIQ